MIRKTAILILLGCGILASMRLAAGTPKTESDWLATRIVADLSGMGSVAAGSKIGLKGIEATVKQSEAKWAITALGGAKVPVFVVDHIFDHKGYATFVSDTLGVKVKARHNAVALVAVGRKLLSLSPSEICNQERIVTQALRADMSNAAAHEAAALLHGTLVLRENAGRFSDPRVGLCRMTAHLAFARALRGEERFSDAGLVAHAILLTVGGRQLDAANLIADLDTKNPTTNAWKRALVMRCRGDWRLATDGKNKSAAEEFAAARATLAASDGQASRGILAKSTEDKYVSTTDWHRILLEDPPSRPFVLVKLDDALKKEAGEFGVVWKHYFRGAPVLAHTVKALNDLPGECVKTGVNKAPEIAAIDWGTWAAFMQRHLCHVFTFVISRRTIDRRYSGLRLYPFVVLQHHRRAVGLSRLDLNRAQDVLLTRPSAINALNQIHFADLIQNAAADFERLRISGLSPYGAARWRQLPSLGWLPKVYDLLPTARSRRQWFSTIAPAGTAFDAQVRMRLLQGDSSAMPGFLQASSQLDPWNANIARRLLFGASDGLRLEDADRMFPDLCKDNLHVIRDLAVRFYANQDEYQQLLKRMSQIDPNAAIAQAELLLGKAQLGQALAQLEQALAGGASYAHVASNLGWIHDYCIAQKAIQRAQKITSGDGQRRGFDSMMRLGRLLEQAKNHTAAEKVFRGLHQTHWQSCEMLGFYVRRGRLDADRGRDQFVLAMLNQIIRDPRIEEGRRAVARRRASEIIFPGGQKKVSAKLKTVPTRGLVVTKTSPAVRHLGLVEGALIVGFNGIHTEDIYQYYFARLLVTGQFAKVLLRQRGAFQEVKVNLTQWDSGVKVINWGGAAKNLDEIVKQRIAQAEGKQKPVTDLDLSDIGLTSIPAEVWEIKTLKQLDLSKNRLEGVPAELAQLQALESLHLTGNRIEEMPAVCGKLPALKSLSLDYNRLRTIAPVIGQLKTLEILNLKGNQIKTLPTEFGNLNKLRMLNLHNNRIRELPESFANLQSLEMLTIAKNGMPKIPAPVLRVKSMTRLVVSMNALTAIPDGIAEMKELKLLDLRDNALAELPGSISKLAKVQRLYLGDNRFRTVPASVLLLPAIRDLDLSGNLLTSLPEGISGLSKLRLLAISDNRLRALPEETLVEMAGHLQRVYYGGNGLDSSAMMALAGKMKKTRLLNEQYD